MTTEDARHTLFRLAISHSLYLTLGAHYLFSEDISTELYEGGFFFRNIAGRPGQLLVVEGKWRLPVALITNTPLSGMASCARVVPESTSIGQHHAFPKKVCLSVSLCLSVRPSVCLSLDLFGAQALDSSIT